MRLSQAILGRLVEERSPRAFSSVTASVGALNAGATLLILEQRPRDAILLAGNGWTYHH